MHGRIEAASVAASASKANTPAASTEGEEAHVVVIPPATLHPDADHANFIFDLAGIVIHMGTAVGGHYYSYIRERSSGGVLTDRWMEFNDTSVLPWDASDASMETDCFGGVDTYRSGGVTYSSLVNGVLQRYTTQAYTTERVRSASAFCLIYDRVPRSRALDILQPPPSARRLPLLKQPSSSVSGVFVRRAALGDRTVPPVQFNVADDAGIRAVFAEHLLALHGSSGDRARLSVRCPVPTELLSEIRQENLEFWKQRTVCEDAYVTFLNQLVFSTAPTPVLDGSVAVLEVPYPWGGVGDWEAAATKGGPAMPAIRLAIAFVLNTISERVRRWRGIRLSEQCLFLPAHFVLSAVHWLEGRRHKRADVSHPAPAHQPRCVRVAPAVLRGGPRGPRTPPLRRGDL